MNVSFVCRQCDRFTRAAVADAAGQLRCAHCQHVYDVPDEVRRGAAPAACLICGCRELFVRKNFSQRLGLAIVIVGFAASSVAWGLHMIYTAYGILFATALIDVALYLTVGNLLQCYRCSAAYRDLAGWQEHEPFNLETHERLRQQAARLEQQQR